MKLQILIPAYKAQDFLKDTLASLADQITTIDYEVLLGIDGCTDTLKTALELKKIHSNLKVYYCEENKGRYIMTNTLIQESTADNLLFFDADDYAMRNLFTEIQNNKDDIMLWKYRILHNNQLYNQPTKDYASGVLFMRRKAIEVLGGYMPWRCSADNELLERAKCSELTMNYNDDVLMVYRRHMNSLTDTIPINHRVQMRKLIKFNAYKEDELYVMRIVNDGEYV